MTRTQFGLVSLGLTLAFAGCSSSEDIDQGAPDASQDARADGTAGSNKDAQTADTRADTQTTDTQVADTQTTDTQVADTQTTDTQVADTQTTDTQVADTQVQDTRTDVTSDANTGADSHPDVVNPPPDAADVYHAPDVYVPPDGGIDFCTQLPKLSAAPTLDGTIEPGLGVTPLGQTNWAQTGTPIPAGNSSRWAAAWFDTGIYFFIEITDPDLYPPLSADAVYKGDGAEFFVDHDGVLNSTTTYDDPGTMHFIVNSPPTKTSNSARAERYKVSGKVDDFAVSHYFGIPTPTGYNIEIVVTGSDLNLTSWSLVQGQNVGIDIGHNVSFAAGQTGSDGYRAGQYFLKGTSPWQRESQFCLPTLVGSITPVDAGPDVLETGTGGDADAATQDAADAADAADGD